MGVKKLQDSLSKMDKTEIIKLLCELYKGVPEAQTYLDIFVTGNIEELIEKYKKEITNYVCPSGIAMIDRDADARKLIRKVRKMKLLVLNIELELHYVECCLKFIRQFGYWDENYYIVIEKMFASAVKGIKELGEFDKYLQKLSCLSKIASEYGIELEY